MNFLTPAPQADVTGEEVMRDWFYQIGLFTVPQFLKPEFCAQLRAEVRQYLSQLAQVGRTDEVQVSSCFTILTGDHWSDWDRRPQPTAGRLANYLDIQIHNGCGTCRKRESNPETTKKFKPLRRARICRSQILRPIGKTRV